MGKYSQPPKPESAAVQVEKQAVANQQTAGAQALLNNTQQITPWGNLWYRPNEAVGYDEKGIPRAWEAITTLSPNQQKINDLSEQADINLGNIGLSRLNDVSAQMGTPLDFSSSLGAVDEWARQNRFSVGSDYINNDAGKKLEDAMFARMAPQIEQDRARLETKLANQGITQGSDAYNAAQKQLEDQIANQRLDVVLAGGQEARNQGEAMAQLDAQRYAQAMGLRGQLSQELMTERQTPLNELMALMSGTQVQSPSWLNTPQTGVSPADYMGAQQGNQNQALAQWQQKRNEASANTGAAASAATAIALAAMMSSDRRVKTNIRRIATLPSGIGLYAYRYIWGSDGVGVMAGEAEVAHPESVVEIGGIKHVRYDMIRVAA